MNKRQKKKAFKKSIEEERRYCAECGEKLDLKHNDYHIEWGTCDSTCYMYLVGMSWSDFY